MEKQTIYINIAKRTYPLQVSEGEMDIMRRAEQLVNETLNSFGQSFQFQSTQDLLAMSAFQLALTALHNEQQVGEQSLAAKLDSLDHLLQRLENSYD